MRQPVRHTDGDAGTDQDPAGEAPVWYCRTVS